MESAKKTIKKSKMFDAGDRVAVAVSGGVDSVALLHFLQENKKELGIELVAVNVDHQIRKTSADDSKFVEDFCNKLGVHCYKFKVSVLDIAEKNKTGIEETARKCRYKLFDSLIKKGIVDKIAIAHHQSDQVETVLLNIFRGSGLKGAGGMEAIQNNYVRPFLNTSKVEILQYAKENNLPFVEDETNMDTNYSRNFLRHRILPELRERWKNIDSNILNFAKICRQDDKYLNSIIDYDDIVFEHMTARIPLYKFADAEPIQNRILKYTFEKLGLSKDIEKRHLTILKNLVKDGENGSKISLPNKLRATLEYDELIVSVPKQKKEFVPKDFKTGKTRFDSIEVSIKKATKFDLNKKNCHIIDASKLPKDVVWRNRQNGDMFAKFGSGEKKLKDYMIDKKIPNSIRDQIPVLANQNEIFCVLGYEISEKVKVTNDTKQVYIIDYKK